MTKKKYYQILTPKRHILGFLISNV